MKFVSQTTGKIHVQIRTMFCKNIEPQIVLINKNNLRTFEPQECQKYKNVEPQQNLSGSYKKKKVYSLKATFLNLNKDGSKKKLFDKTYSL